MILRNKIVTVVNSLLPKFKKKIVFYGRKKCESNQHALIRYLIDNGYNEKYKIYLVFSDREEIKSYENTKNVVEVTGTAGGIWHTLTGKFVFHCWGWGRMFNHPPKRQLVFDIWHGTPLKTLEQRDEDYYKNSSFMLAACDFAENYFKKCFGYKDEQFYIGGYPRCDSFFCQKDALREFGINKDDFGKIILFMPTFRRSAEWGINDCKSDFPLFDGDKLRDFNEYLRKNGLLFIIKPHPAQDEIQMLRDLNLSNVRVMKNSDLQNKDVLLYDLVANSDILLTDYSSIYFDYLLTQKPIGFVIEDINEYSGSRGFVVDDPLDYMPGEKIGNVEELKKFTDDILAGNDDWKTERKKINDLVNADQSGDYCKKILDFVGIVK